MDNSNRNGDFLITLLVGTRKGAFLITGSPEENSWLVSGPSFLGAAVNHLVLDPRDGRTLLMAAHPGHLGPTIYRSTDQGKTWLEASAPPAFPKAEGGESVRYTMWLQSGHASEPGVWYAGTCPPALFRTSDGGDTWEGVAGFNEHPMRKEWAALGQGFEIPNGNVMHSIQIDPRDARHMYFGISPGGVFETTDQGQTWQPLNKGIVSYFLPDPEAEYGHDPHALRIHPQNPTCCICKRTPASTEWIAKKDVGTDGKGDAGRGGGYWLPDRAAPARCGYRPGFSRWTAPRSGRGPARAANRRCTVPEIGEQAGAARMRASRGNTAILPSSARP